MRDFTRIIAEIGQAHDGSLSVAHKYIDAVADAGVDAIKFQIHFADEETTLDDSFRPGAETNDPSRFEYWKRMEFSNNQWIEIADHVSERGCEFFASCFSARAYELADKLGTRSAKLSSGEIIDRQWPFTSVCSKETIYISTGMSGWEEIDKVVEEFKAVKEKVVLMQCTSAYPTKLEEVGLNVCDEFRERYGVRVGLSDHSGTPFPAVAAIAHECDAVEVHVVAEGEVGTPDTTSSVTIDELRWIRDFRDAFEIIRSNGVDKDMTSRDLSDMRARFSKSLSLRYPLDAGEVIQATNLALKKPGDGIPWQRKGDVVGKRTRVPVAANRLIRWEDLDCASNRNGMR